MPRWWWQSYVNIMINQPLSIRGFPRAILHIDGDAFFASCEQSRNPKLKNKPVVTGKERGIAASLSYEAKERGVKRGMPLRQIKKICPEAIILPSDYETYSLLSQRFFSIVRRYTPQVEEYSIDECFADLTGLRRPRQMSYEQLAERIKQELDVELGFTFSVGLGPNKVIAKIGSKWNKPSGITIIPGYRVHKYLAHLELDKIWGIGSETKAYLEKYGITTALQFAGRDEFWVLSHLTKPHVAIWKELHGEYIFTLENEERKTHYSVQKVKTFTPPSGKRSFVFAQLSKNIENACIKLRRYGLAAREAVLFLKRQDFSHAGIRLDFYRSTCTPAEIINMAENNFDTIYDSSCLYRATGAVLFGLESNRTSQLDLFGKAIEEQKLIRLYEVVDTINKQFGKHKVHLLSSATAHGYDGEKYGRGDLPKRKYDLLPGESRRKRVGIPMFTGEIS